MRHAFAWVAMTEAFLAANQTLLPHVPSLLLPGHVHGVGHPNAAYHVRL